jgi:hypothetical protein
MIHYRSLFEELVTDARASDAPAIGGKRTAENVATIRVPEDRPTREKVK